MRRCLGATKEGVLARAGTEDVRRSLGATRREFLQGLEQGM